MTNFEKLKQMSVEEFAERVKMNVSVEDMALFIESKNVPALNVCRFCFYGKDESGDNCVNRLSCVHGVKKWLKQEAEDDG